MTWSTNSPTRGQVYQTMGQCTTSGEITGLRPFTQYVVMVSGENGVSAQATDASGRTVSATIMTEEGGEFSLIFLLHELQDLL